MSRRDMAFQSDGTTLRGWLYEPDGADGPHPLVVMAHGFSATKEMYRAKTWQNEVTLRSVEMFVAYEPGAYLPLISPTPLLMAVAAEDHLTPADLALGGYERAREPKRLVVLPGGHFEAYTGENFTRSSAIQRDWFTTHLAGTR